MINKALLFVAKMAVGNKLIGVVAKLNNALKGHRSEINLGVLALVHGLKIGGVIDAGTASAIEASLLAILPVTLADKASSVRATLDAVVPVVPAPAAEAAPEAPKDEAK